MAKTAKADHRDVRLHTGERSVRGADITMAGARQSVPQFGGILIRCGDEDLFVRTFVRDIARPAVE